MAAITPDATANAPVYGTFDFTLSYASYPVTWTFGVSNATSVSINYFTNFTETPSGILSGNVYTVTGYVPSMTHPSIVLTLTNTIAGYTTSTVSPGFTGGISPDVVTALVPYANERDFSLSSYMAWGYPVTWNFMFIILLRYQSSPPNNLMGHLLEFSHNSNSLAQDTDFLAGLFIQ